MFEVLPKKNKHFKFVIFWYKVQNNRDCSTGQLSWQVRGPQQFVQGRDSSRIIQARSNQDLCLAIFMGFFRSNNIFEEASFSDKRQFSKKRHFSMKRRFRRSDVSKKLSVTLLLLFHTSYPSKLYCFLKTQPNLLLLLVKNCSVPFKFTSAKKFSDIIKA